MTGSATSTAARQRERLRLLQAIRDATAALTGPHATGTAAARWLAHRAACYEALAAAHRRENEEDLAAMAEAAAALDHAQAHTAALHERDHRKS